MLVVLWRQSSSGGRTQNWTGDTRIFSPLLYQLSYPATLEKAALRLCLFHASTEFFTFFTYERSYFSKNSRLITTSVIAADIGRTIYNRIQSVSPNNGSQGSIQAITITFNANNHPPLPPINPNNVTIHGISLNQVSYNNSIVTGTLNIPDNAALGVGDVIISFPSPNGTLRFISENSFSIVE